MLFGPFKPIVNKQHKITPKTIVKGVAKKRSEIKGTRHLPKSEIQRRLIELDAKMRSYAARLEFEKAIQLRDRITELETALDRILKKERSSQKTSSINL